jgi:hypothetical protein
MHKFPIPIATDPPPRPKYRRLRSLAIVVLGISLAPLIVEACTICHAQWCQVLGRNARADTPVLDAVQSGIESGHRSVEGAFSPYFQRLPWNPKLVFGVGVILMIIAMFMLKL